LQHTVDNTVGDTTYPGEHIEGGGDWSLPALGFLALVDTVCEPIPDGAASDTVTTYATETHSPTT